MNDTTLHLLELTLKGSILLCAGLGLRFWLIHSSAAQRSVIWTILFAMLLVLPLGLMTKPVWPVQVKWPTQEFAAPTSPIMAESSVATTAIAKLPEPPMQEPWNSSAMLLSIYGLGVAAVLGFRLLGSLQAWLLEKNALPIPSALKELLPRSKPHIRVRISPDIAVPMTWGTTRPVIAFPVACETWSREELRAAFQHEMAHVIHRDALRRWLGTLVCALWWPLPFVWMASRAWKLEQERACDDAVLHAGHDAALYATQLLHSARQWQQHRFQTTAALVMAMPAGLEARLRSVVSTSMNRNPLRRGMTSLAYCIGVCMAALGIFCQAESDTVDGTKQILIRTKFIQASAETAKKAGLPTEGAVVLTEAQFQEMIQSLSQQKKVDFMSAPSVTTKDGQAARIEVTRDFFYPTALDKDGVTPSTFDMKPVGVMVDVLPKIQSRERISIKVEPLIRDFQGFEIPSQPGKLFDKPGNEVKKGELARPAFHERGWKGSVTLENKTSQIQRLDSLPSSSPLAKQAAEDGRTTWFLLTSEIIDAPPPSKPIAQTSEASVTIYGKVHRQGKYPLKAGMTVTDLIEQAQGLTDKAAQQIELERGEKKARTKHQLDLPAGGSFPLGDGDTLTVLENKPKITSNVGDAWEGPAQMPDGRKYTLQELQAYFKVRRQQNTDLFQMMSRFDNGELNTTKQLPLGASDPDSVWKHQIQKANEVIQAHRNP